MSQGQRENPTTTAIMDQILNANKEGEPSEEAIQMPELALRCAQFFHSLSQYCLYFYKNYNREADIHKTKLIKKADKSSKNNNNKSKKSYQEQRRRAQRGQNEPQPPKKPLTAYIIYFQDKKPAFAQKFPSLSLSQLTKLIAKDWKDLKDEQKKPYLDKASDDRKRYQVQMNEFKRKYHRKEGEEIQQQAIVLQQSKKQIIMEPREQEILLQLKQLSNQEVQLQSIAALQMVQQLNKQSPGYQNLDEENQDNQQEGEDEDDDNNEEQEDDDEGQEDEQVSEEEKIDEEE